MARTRVVIDTDPGVDDAVAILLALASPELEVVGITTVNGNVAVDLTTTNARRLLQLAQAAHVPIGAGAAVPLGGPVEHAAQVHGDDGLGDLLWDEPTIATDARDAVDLISDLADEGPLTLIAIGPLTNLAELVRRRPDTVAKLERVVIMGGASFMGNVTAVAEFNVWADPRLPRSSRRSSGRSRGSHSTSRTRCGSMITTSMSSGAGGPSSVIALPACCAPTPTFTNRSPVCATPSCTTPSRSTK